ncbi:MAG: hypothetical protein JNN30_07640 [Rhodanobacteraceae bacterium]|nr:hypothetical protein [Rhodanobacteraceae bacterium]
MLKHWLYLFFLALIAPSGPSAAQMQSGEIRKASLPLSQHMLVEIVVKQPALAIDVLPRAGVVFSGGFAVPSFSPGDVKAAEQAIALLRERAGELELGAMIADAAARKLDRDTFAPELAIEMLVLPSGTIYPRRDRPPQKRVMVLEPRFGFNASASELKLSIQLQIEDRISVDGRSRARPQFLTSATFAYTAPDIAEAGDRDTRLALWAVHVANRDRFRQLLRDAVDPAFDMLNAAFLTRNEKPDRTQIHKESVDGVSTKLAVLKEQGGRRWFKLAPTTVGLMRSVGPLPAD